MRYLPRPMAPVEVQVQDTQTGRNVTLTVIGIVSESAPIEMSGLLTSQKTLAQAFPGSQLLDEST